MAANYLHGVETIELNIGPRPISVVKSAVIGIVGVAPTGPTQELTLVQSQADAAQFGALVPGFSIPRALESIQKQGAGTVLVVNVFKASTNAVQITDETHVIADGKFELAHYPLTALTITLKDGSNGALVLGTDLTVNEFGICEIVAGGAVTEGDTVKVTYKYFDPSTVTSAQIIGAIDGVTNARTGSKLFDLAFQTFGFTPRILIAPEYITDVDVSTEFIALADKFRSHTIIDAPIGETPSDVIEGRGPAGTINFYTSSKRAILCYPHLKAYDPATDADINVPYSSFMAGVIAATDNANGYWYSPSNREIKGIVGVERTITAAVNDASTEANLLNEKGICTIFNSFGSGLRTWGNRSASFPSSTAPSNFISVQRTADILHESVEYAMLQFIDQPINNALIDAIRDSVNGFINVLIQRGAIVDGSCTFDVSKNPPVVTGAGQLIFDVTFMPPTPAERITFESYIDINLLSSLGTNQ